MTSGLVHMLLVHQTSPKGRGAYVGDQIESRGRSGPKAGRSAVWTVRGGGADGPRVHRISYGS
jgi:hypothetical protein